MILLVFYICLSGSFLAEIAMFWNLSFKSPFPDEEDKYCDIDDLDELSTHSLRITKKSRESGVNRSAISNLGLDDEDSDAEMNLE